MKKILSLSVIALAFMIYSCGPKTTEIATLPDSAIKTTDLNNPCRSFANLSSGDKEDAENAFVLYKDQIQFKKWDAALRVWKVAYNLAPGSNGKVTSHFGDGVQIYSELAKASNDKALQRKYIDTIKMINAKFEQCFGADATQLARRAFDYYYVLGDLMPEDETFETFKKAIDKNEGKLLYFIVNPFTKMLYDRVIAEKISINEGRKYAKLIQNSIEEGQKNCKGQECESWGVVRDYSPDRLDALEGVDGFYDCEYYTKKYYALYKASPDDCEIINSAYAKFLRGGCPMTNAILIEVKKAKDTKCIIAPPAPGTLRQAYDAYGDGRYREAIKLFDQGIIEASDNERKAKIALTVAKIYYGDLKNFPLSRKYAYDAAKFKSGWGEPFILIGKLYASSGPLCGPGRGFDSQVVTWVAIDKFAYAKSIDGSVASEANKLIAQYSQYMPSNDDVFLRTNITKGGPFFVGCWIQESTIVRTAN